MRPIIMRVPLIALALLLSSAVAAADETPGDAATLAAVPAPPEGQGNATASTLEPAAVDRERQALDRIGERFASRLRQLQELALQTKGMERADLQRRIEALKAEQAREELQARIDLAREAGDEDLVRKLERVSEQPAPPREDPEPRREFRPIPAGDGNGGAR